MTDLGSRARNGGAKDESVIDDGGGADEEGRSIEDRAADGEHEQEDDGTPQLVLPGTGPKLSTQIGGKKPTESMFKMRGLSLPISGNVQMEKDTTRWVAVEVAVDDVGLKNHRKDRSIVAVTRTHIATPLGAPVILTDEQIRGLGLGLDE